MREKQKESDRKKRVESPFAKYNSLGHLSCVLCKVPVKSEILWQAHVLGKPHKDKVAELKGAKQTQAKNQTEPRPDQASLLKRKAPDTDTASGKRLKDAGSTSSGLPPGFFDGGKKPSSLGILSGMYDEDDDEGDDDDNKADDQESHGGRPGKAENVRSSSAPAPVEVATGLPADFFDSGIPPAPSVSHSGSISKPDEDTKVTEKRDNTAEALPEGFFDDPVRDAKVRNVDTPKDIMDKEWEDFQKEMRQVNSASDAIVAEDDEEGRLERQIDEIDEQIECYRRVEVLRDKQEVVREKITLKKGVSTESFLDSDEEDEEELLHVLSRDWRAKGALA